MPEQDVWLANKELHKMKIPVPFGSGIFCSLYDQLINRSLFLAVFIRILLAFHPQ
jgi:hypothetical protein